jgi:hypothetical protein
VEGMHGGISGQGRIFRDTSKLEIEGSRPDFGLSLESYLDRLGEIGIILGFVDNGFDTESAIEKVSAFES